MSAHAMANMVRPVVRAINREQEFDEALRVLQQPQQPSGRYDSAFEAVLALSAGAIGIPHLFLIRLSRESGAPFAAEGVQGGETVIAKLAFFFVANYTLSFISVFVLRRREPDRPRPFRAWGYPWTTALALLGSIAFLAGAVASDTRNSLYALLLLAASYPGYHAIRTRQT